MDWAGGVNTTLRVGMLQRESNKTQGVVTSPLSHGRQAWDSGCSEGVSLRLSPTGRRPPRSDTWTSPENHTPPTPSAHFTSEKTEAPKGKRLSQGHTVYGRA